MDQSQNSTREYSAISPTSRSSFWMKTFTDIPYVREIYDELEKGKQSGAESKIRDYGINHVGLSSIAPYFEARYLIINRLLKEVGATQIIELASGLTPRGLELTKDPNITFIELDLPDVIEEKKKIVENIIREHKIGDRNNLYLEAGSALEEADIMKAASHFDEKKEIAIINEGLLRYLKRDEQAKMAQAILPVLQKFGGVWITPDIGIRDKMLAGQAKLSPIFIDRTKKLEKMTGAGNFSDNLFADAAEAKAIYEKLGFEIEMHTYSEVSDQLVSPTKLGQPKEITDSLMEWSKVFVMHPKTK